MLNKKLINYISHRTRQFHKNNSCLYKKNRKEVFLAKDLNGSPSNVSIY